MNNCKELRVCMSEITFLMEKMNGLVRALYQIRPENNTENLKNEIRIIEFGMLMQRNQMNSLCEELDVINSGLQYGEENDQ